MLKLYSGVILAVTKKQLDTRTFIGWHYSKEEALGAWIDRMDELYPKGYSIVNKVITNITKNAENREHSVKYGDHSND